ncbi:proline/glycine betaine ABC transporter permease [Pseudomonas sp. p106]|uniref:ABC transporter permease n=1 Tax=Pseudomonas TaxID=286 RepID=UPI000F774A6F|nr:ABC transporter permease subunit [Pseudomonas sp. p106]QPN47476.1 ABC transporter permease subunit [Priestia aryabhattai]RRV42698.1 ABC transporter permease subunit [Pseudomonas sp. p106]
MNLTDLKLSPGAWLAPAVDWLNTNWHPLFAFISKVIEAMLGGIEAALLWVPFYLMIPLVAVLALLAIGVRAALLAACMLGFCWLSGLWASSMQTLALVSVSVLISVAIAFPLGVLASRFKRLDRTLGPLMNVMQTVPPWVYLIPAVMVFSLGKVPAIIATIVYGIPPMLRLTTLAFNQVRKDLLELGRASGATPGTILLKIELPTAMPTLVVGLNQCILLSLAMVVLAGLVGAGGLGAEVTRGLTRMEMGLGLRAGLAIVAVALLLDRLSRGALQRGERPA